MRKLSITQKFKNLKKQFIAVLASLLIIATPLTALAAWGPERPTYDYNDPVGARGSLNGPVFNSFTNAPNYGDERNFVTVSEGGKADWKGSVTAQADQEVEVRAYVHNNANETTNASGLGVAKNTQVRFFIPEGLANKFEVAGYVSADNANPARVYDTANVVNDAQAFSLSYVPGSAKLYNNGPFTNGVALPDDVVGSGAKIGYDALNGDLPGCFEYKAVVVIKVKVKAPKLQVEKKVTTPGSSDWKESLRAKKGDTVSWLIDFKNTGSEVINNLTIRDQIPAGLSVVPGSVMWFDDARPNGQQLNDDALSSGGVNVGNYGPNGGGYIRFRTVVNELPQCVAKNVAYARGDNVPEDSDTAEVIQEDCKPSVEKPAEPVVTPPVTVLPSTGAGSVITGVLGSSATAYGAYSLFQKRRFLKK